MLFASWATVPGMRLDFIDVVRASSHAKARGGACVEFSREDHEEGNRGLLRKVMYGARAAAHTWELGYADDDGGGIQTRFV